MTKSKRCHEVIDFSRPRNNPWHCIGGGYNPGGKKVGNGCLTMLVSAMFFFSVVFVYTCRSVMECVCRGYLFMRVRRVFIDFYLSYGQLVLVTVVSASFGISQL